MAAAVLLMAVAATTTTKTKVTANVAMVMICHNDDGHQSDVHDGDADDTPWSNELTFTSGLQEFSVQFRTVALQHYGCKKADTSQHSDGSSSFARLV